MTSESTNKNSYGRPAQIPCGIMRGKHSDLRYLPRTELALVRGSDAGFTLIEVLVYIALLVSVLFVISSFLIWITRANSKIKATMEVSNNARRAMEIMTYEIREGKSAYTPTSIFNSHPGQLSLATQKYVPADEKNTYIDFYVSAGKICLKKEAQSPICLTSERVEVKNLIFRQVLSNQIPSVEIDLTVDYKNPSGISDYGASVNLRSVASPRSY